MADNIDMANQNKKKQSGGMSEFLYNKETGEVMGRSGAGWVKLLIFYLIYYGCLAGFFAAMLAIFFINISVNVPKYFNNDGLILDYGRNFASPGMGFRPLPDYTTTLVAFEANKPETYKVYGDNIQTFLESYNPDNKPEDTKRKSCGPNSIPDATNACEFIPNQELGTCGKTKAQARLGYDQGKPCIILKLNKIFGWQADPIKCSKPDGTCDGLSDSDIEWFRSTGRPDVALNELFNGLNIPVTCEGINPADKENLLSIDWEPSKYHGSFPTFFYPFLNQRGYVAPLVSAQFTVTRGVLVMVRCRAWAKNIANDNFLSKDGAVHFELMVD